MGADVGEGEVALGNGPLKHVQAKEVYNNEIRQIDPRARLPEV